MTDLMTKCKNCDGSSIYINNGLYDDGELIWLYPCNRCAQYKCNKFTEYCLDVIFYLTIFIIFVYLIYNLMW